VDINAFEGTAFDSGAFQIAVTADLNATETPDTAAASAVVFSPVDLAATEGQDAFAADVLVTDGLIMDATESPDIASGGLSVYWAASLTATEAPDTAAFAATRNVPLVAAPGVVTLQGNSAVLAAFRAFYPESGQYSQSPSPGTLAHYRRLNARSANYIISGHIARLYQSSFFYNDVEIIFVPPEIQHAELVFENRVVLVNAGWTVERLAEDREASGEPRLRAV
jgi:hypothetical protein